LLTLSLQIALLPMSFPFMNFTAVSSLSLDLVVEKLSFILAPINVCHYPKPSLLAPDETAFVNHTVQDFLPTPTMGFRFSPLPLVPENLLLKIISELEQSSLPFKLPSLALSSEVGSIAVDVNAGAFSLALGDWAIEKVMVAKL
jgi:hypothetical protein